MICIVCIAFIGMLTLLGFVDKKQKALPCAEIVIRIDNSVQHDFINESDILALINGNVNIVGTPVGSINISLLEKKIMNNPYVEQAEVYSTIDGKLQVNVVQRDPVVRIMTMRDESFYIDRSGKFMPVCDHYSTPVIVASGYIFDAYAEMHVPVWEVDTTVTDTSKMSVQPVLSQIYSLSQYIGANEFWNAQIEQIYINDQGDIELIPRVGNHRIILGSVTALEEKLNRLYIFYTKGLNKTGWNNYSIINLKYKNQVVCTKINS